jgi:hypothetical protein
MCCTALRAWLVFADAVVCGMLFPSSLSFFFVVFGGGGGGGGVSLQSARHTVLPR